MNNRLEITPLLEENMNQMIDGEFSINQLNGHITIKRGQEYISKTKEINIECIDKTEFKNNLIPKINEDERKLATYKTEISSIERINAEIEAKLKSLEADIVANENKCNNLEDRLRRLDNGIANTKIEGQLKIYDAINSNLHLVAKLLIENELMDRIKDNKLYFKNYVENHWNYPDIHDVIHNYGTVQQNEKNKQELATKVSKDEFNAYAQDLKNRYKAYGANYDITGSY